MNERYFGRGKFKKKLLFISSSIGLGHVVRDLAIAKRLRREYPLLKIGWLAGKPAAEYLKQQGEDVYGGESAFGDMSKAAESAATEGGLNLFRYVLRVRPAWRKNTAAFKRAIDNERFDCIVADEAYEIEAFLHNYPEEKEWPFIVIHDFIGIEVSSKNLIERIGVRIINKKWIQPHADLSLFVGVPEDIPDERFGVFLPNKRDYASAKYHFVGYVLPFEPVKLPGRKKLKEGLGLGKAPLIVCSAGGTAAGRPLLKLCIDAFLFVRRRIPEVQMLIAAGPRIDPDELWEPVKRSAVVGGADDFAGLRVLSFVPDLYRYFGAADVCIVQGGGMTAAELTALETPFLYVPLEGHSEQEKHIHGRLQREGRGIPLKFRETSPAGLAEMIVRRLEEDGGPRGNPKFSNSQKELYNGAERAASAILQILKV